MIQQVPRRGQPAQPLACRLVVGQPLFQSPRPRVIELAVEIRDEIFVKARDVGLRIICVIA
jgi:hypothetical protein